MGKSKKENNEICWFNMEKWGMHKLHCHPTLASPPNTSNQIDLAGVYYNKSPTHVIIRVYFVCRILTILCSLLPTRFPPTWTHVACLFAWVERYKPFLYFRWAGGFTHAWCHGRGRITSRHSLILDYINACPPIRERTVS